MRRNPFGWLGILLAGGVALTASAERIRPGAPGGTPPALVKRAPSVNKGRTGKYQCHTGHSGYDYWVYVPSGYSDDNPAGLHLHFHGQSNQDSAPEFGWWDKFFLEPYNLIGIDMQYQDGDNITDTAGKTAAAWEAVTQTLADYKIVAGRGVVSCFSGGGLPAGLLVSKYARAATPPGPEWPFCHMSLYSSNYRDVITDAPPMTWFISVGTAEWTLAGAGLGDSQTGRMADLLRLALKGGSPDLGLMIMKGKGHEMKEEERTASARMFPRSDLAYAPFLYAPDYPEKDLAPIVRDANALSLGKALKALDGLLARDAAPAAVKAKGERLRGRIAARVQAAADLCRELAGTDPGLAEHYGRIFTRQLGDLPEVKAVKEALAEMRKKKEFAAAQQCLPLLEKNFRTFFRGAGQLSPTAVPFVQDLQRMAGASSLFGSMAAEFLGLQ